jgi:tetratricopeptide (TPR) repeat protein
MQPTIPEVLIQDVLAKLKSLSDKDFVNLIQEHLRMRADFSNVEPGPAGPDEKVDILATLQIAGEPPRKIAFQCKRYTTTPLTDSHVNEVFMGMTHKGADEGVLVSTRKLTLTGERLAAKIFSEYARRIQYRDWCEGGLCLNLIGNTPSVLVRWFPELLRKLPIAHELGHLCPSFEIVPVIQARQAVRADRFFNGFPPSWENLSAGHDIERQTYTGPEGAKKLILSMLAKNDGPLLVAYLGSGGCGKTTLLRRTGFDLAREGSVVLRLTEDWRLVPASLSKQIGDIRRTTASPVVILIDNAGDLALDVDILNGTISELSEHKNVVIVLAEQLDRWHSALRRLPLLVNGVNYFPRFVHHLLHTECETLVDKILEYESNGTLSEKLSDLSRGERLQLCTNVADRQLLVAMFQMRHGLQFRRIMEREYDRIPTVQGKDAYAYVCYFNGFGLPLPLNLILRALKISGAVSTQELLDSTDGLFRENMQGLQARHAVIARAVVAYGLRSPEAKKQALTRVLTVLELETSRESRKPDEAIFLRIFGSRGVHKRLGSDLQRRTALVREMYDDVRSGVGQLSRYFLKYIATSQALTERWLGNQSEAKDWFEEAIRLDPTYVFAYRQYAWFEHARGNWVRAGDLATKAADIAPSDYLANLHCARILSFNTLANFKKAGQYYQRALQISPTERRLGKDLERYESATAVASIVSNLEKDALIPEYVYENLRPGLAFLRAVHGPRSGAFRRRLTGDLQEMAQQVYGELADLYDVIADVPIDKDSMLRAAVTCQMARLRYLEWYHRGEQHDADETERLFKASMQLNDNDPFTHCWYGTFLKEVRHDFETARKEYETALALGDKSRQPWLHRHPLFLNNVGLLIMDEIQLGRSPAGKLADARKILEEAVQVVERFKSDFLWPYQSLSLCFELTRAHDVGRMSLELDSEIKQLGS